ncbi:MAG: dihydroorotate dehydrogenase-like protein [Bacteroidales bacterium]|nr:dihydroorotate dehydrogenase-like protein [Bacteroidales bacterium]
MANLTTSFAGLKLRNPFIISSSGLTSSVERIRKFDALGAGAVVIKSLFEEQILFEIDSLSTTSDYPEAFDYINRYTKENSVGEYLELIRNAKKAVQIPVIASINCVTAGEWINFASQIEQAGADALELNLFFMPVDKDKSAQDYEKVYFQVVEKLKAIISIPLIIKIGAYFTNPLNLINQLFYRKVDGVVMFNRFYSPDVDLDEMTLVSSDVFSSPADLRNTLRWTGIVSGKIPEINIAASTGIHSGEAVIKLLLAGATSVQVCSVLYKNGVEYLTDMIDKLESWMLANNYKSLDEFRGKMNYANFKDPMVYERSQFMKYFSNLH